MPAYLVVTVVVLAALVVARFVWNYFRLRGTRVVTCPETRETAAVEIGSLSAAATGLVGHPRFHLHSCSHWPEKAACGQACIAEINQAPSDCLVRTHLEQWYRDKTCALCRREVGQIDWLERRPALLAPDNQPLLWQDLEAEHLFETLRTHRPLCFDCYVAETFRRTHPELVLDNPFAPPPPGRS